MKFNKLRAGLSATAEPIFAEEEPTYNVLMNLAWAALLLVLILFFVVWVIDRYIKTRG